MANIAAPHSLVSIFIPAPADIHVTANTFIRFSTSNQSDAIGLIISVHAASSRVTVRHFWPWEQLCNHLDGDLPPNITFWPLLQQNHPPYFVCDTDITSEISTLAIRGLVFVFHEDDPIVHQLHGMANTYVISSYFKSTEKVLIHGRTFSSFPSTMYRNLPTCFASQLFSQLLYIKNKLHKAMNSRSMNSKNCVIFQCDMIDPSTWIYMKKYLPAPVYTQIVCKEVYVGEDDGVVEKYRGLQEVISLSLPDHLPMAQNLFGSGVGFRCNLTCRLGRLGRNKTSHPVEETDTLNIVPFEPLGEGEEFVRRGIDIKYVRCLHSLTVVVHFNRINGATTLLPHLQRRRMVPGDLAPQPIHADSWPLHSKIGLFDHQIQSIN